MKALLGARPQLFLPQVTGGKVGEIIMFSGSDEPQDWLFCDGRAISRQTFEELFLVIGTTFGAGDGSTTFNIPDFRGRFPVGVGAIATGDSSAETYWGGATAGSVDVPLGQRAGEAWHTLTAQQMPAHGHNVKTWVSAGTLGAAKGWNNYGASNYTVTSGNQLANGTWKSASFNAAQGGLGDPTGLTDAQGGGARHNNMPPFTGINFIICFKARAAGEGGTTSVDKITAGEIDYITNL